MGTIADKLLYLDETKTKLREAINGILYERGEPLIAGSDTFRSYVDRIWTPSALFANGEQGAWYDPSDLSTLFQDAAGTIPVTSAGDPVGLMLDKSGRGNHATQSVSAARPTYQTDGALHWLAFDGVDDHMRTPIQSYSAQLTVFFAAAAGVAQASEGLVVSSASTAGADNGLRHAFKLDGAQTGRFTYYAGLEQGIGIPVASMQESPHAMAVRGVTWDGTKNHLAVRSFFNGEPSVSATAGRALSLGAQTLAPLTVGALAVPVSRFLSGRVCGLVVRESSIYGLERQVSLFLAAKSGVTL